MCPEKKTLSCVSSSSSSSSFYSTTQCYKSFFIVFVLTLMRFCVYISALTEFNHKTKTFFVLIFCSPFCCCCCSHGSKRYYVTLKDMLKLAMPKPPPRRVKNLSNFCQNPQNEKLKFRVFFACLVKTLFRVL